MAGRTGGIWRRLRYLNKWRAIRNALTPDQSAEADQHPATRARFAMRKSPFPSERPAVSIDAPPVDLAVFGVEISKPEEASARPGSSSQEEEEDRERKRERSTHAQHISAKSPSKPKPAKPRSHKRQAGH